MNNDFETDMWDKPDFNDPEEFQDPISYEYSEEELEEDEGFDLEEEIGGFEDWDDEDYEFMEELEEQSLIDNARVRLEQGRLYEMLIKHNLFDGVDAHPEAVSKVQEELKSFIMERLEILLGMKQEKETEIHQIVNKPQFNDMEVEALKSIASRLTKGKSEEAPTTAPEPVANELNTVKQVEQEPTINALGSKKKQKQPVTKIKQPSAKKTPKRARKARPTRSKKRSARRPKMGQEAVKTPVEHMTPEQIAKKDLDYVNKLGNMSLEDANKIVSQRHKRPVSGKGIDQSAINGHYEHKVMMNNNKLSDYGKLLKAVALKEAKQRSPEME
jgi:hypothetical protein